MQASILGIGTELTTGQILNRNAQWISAQLNQLGLKTSLHLVTPDDRALIQAALEFCQKNSDLIFVTGGLGPTTDDFTREVLAQFFKKELKWNEDAWQWIQKRLSERGIAAKEIQKQQCYFPEGAKILTNAQGTAHGFYVQFDRKHWFALPGPPREIDAIWKDHLGTLLHPLLVGIDPFVTKSWDCLGSPESEVATLTENAAKDYDFELGYRVHLPYVEVKATYLKSKEASLMPGLQKISQVLKPICIDENIADIAAAVAEKLLSFSDFQLVDSLSGGYLLNRLSPFLKPHLKKNSFNYSSQPTNSEFAIKLSLIEDSSGATCALKTTKQTQQIHIDAPFKNSFMRERELQYFAEKAMFFWYDNL